MKSGRTPAKIRFHATFDSPIKEGEHHAEHARVGVDAAHRHALDPHFFEPSNCRRRETITLLRQNDVTVLRLDEKVGVRRSREARSLLELRAKQLAFRIHEARKYPALEPA